MSLFPSLAEVKALTDPSTATLEYMDIGNNLAIEVVYISTTPETTQYPIAKACVQAGKNVLLEKPIALELVEANELIDLSHEKKFNSPSVIYSGLIQKLHTPKNQ